MVLAPRLVVVALVVALLGVTVVRVLDASGGGSSRPGVSGVLPGELTGPAPWPRNIGALRSRLEALGLPPLAVEGTVLHIHSHLDIYVRGRRVTVPAGVGINPGLPYFSPLHTHDATGVMHVESPTVRAYTLGEFFGVWGVRLTSRCVGGYCDAGKDRFRVFSDGRPVANPARLPLAAHEEVAVTYGTERQLPHPVPSGYAFAAGL
jgi:hypothetical protein